MIPYQYIALASDRNARIFNADGVETVELQHSGDQQAYVRALAFSYNNTFIYTASEDAMLRIWNARSGR